MSVSLIVPWRPDGAERDRNWSWLRARYRETLPGWEIVEGTCAAGQWSKGEAVNSAAERASGDVLVIADADVLIAADALLGAVHALSSAPWVIPHKLVYRLTEDATRALLEGRLTARPRPMRRGVRRARPGPAGGGLSVTRRSDFESVGGIDERFYGWGGEDISFARALDTLVGAHLRLDDPVWHLHHPPMGRRPGDRASAASEELAGRYLEANGDRVAMASLCAEHPYCGAAGGGVLVAPRETIRRVPLDERFRGWGQEDRSWALALAVLAGEPARLGADLVHLWHPPQDRLHRKTGSAAGLALGRRYLKARRRGERDAMEALIEEARSGAAS